MKELKNFETQLLISEVESCIENMQKIESFLIRMIDLNLDNKSEQGFYMFRDLLNRLHKTGSVLGFGEILDSYGINEENKVTIIRKIIELCLD